jgi:8-oxo-dGTP pyrophosphatase MutT (NUDIX family)
MILDESFGIIPLRRRPDGVWEVFLILHKSGHHWSFPKGHKDHAEEDAFAAAERELFEETALRIANKLPFPPLQETYEFRHHKGRVRKTVQYFAAEVTGEPKLQPEEIRDGRWIALADAPKLLTFKEAQAICARVMQLLAS